MDPDYLSFVKDLHNKLRALFGASNAEVYIFRGGGSDMMEMVVSNFIAPGDTVHVINTGSFADRWHLMAKRHGAFICESKNRDGWGKTFYPPSVVDFLAGYKPALVLMQASDTSTGVRNDCGLVGRLARDLSPKTLLAVDAVLEAAVSPIKMGAEEIDIVIGASQKAFMLPPGLGFILLGPRAQDALTSRSHAYPTWVYDLRDERSSPRGAGFPRYTSPVDHMAGLSAVLDHILPQEEIWYRNHAERAKYLREKLATLGFSLFTEDQPSNGTSVLTIPPKLTVPQLISELRQEGYLVTGGFGGPTPNVIRIAQFEGTREYDEGLLTAFRKILNKT